MITGAAGSVGPVLVHVITGALTQTPSPNTPTLDQVLNNILKLITGVLGTLTVVAWSVAGVRYVASQGDPGEIESAKRAVKAGALGFALTALAPLLIEILRSLVSK